MCRKCKRLKTEAINNQNAFWAYSINKQKEKEWQEQRRKHAKK